VRLIVPFPPGGPNDVFARLIGQWLHERLGQPIIIDNRPGAGGNIGTEVVVKAAPDGYTLLLINSNHTVNATLYDKLNYNFIRDIAPVAAIIQLPLVLVLNPLLPAKTLLEFTAHAKANPGKLNYASVGNGSTPHVAGELFKMMAGIDMVHVPYRGAVQALTDLISGQVQAMFIVPAPKDMPSEIVDKLNKEINVAQEPSTCGSRRLVWISPRTCFKFTGFVTREERGCPSRHAAPERFADTSDSSCTAGTVHA
jgi:hypothetical protein